jgi:hypothetical protein
MWFFIFLYLVSSEKPKLCINCKFYTKDFFTYFIGSEFGKCSRFTLEKNDNYLVNGVKKIVTEKYYCSTARISTCGKEGKFYEEREKLF